MVSKIAHCIPCLNPANESILKYDKNECIIIKHDPTHFCKNFEIFFSKVEIKILLPMKIFFCPKLKLRPNALISIFEKFTLILQTTILVSKLFSMTFLGVVVNF